MRSLDFQDPCARHLEFGTSHPRDYELLYGRGWMERVTTDAQGVEIDRFTAHLVRAGIDERRVAHVAYAIMMMLHGVVMHRLSSKTQSPLGQRRQLRRSISGARERRHLRPGAWGSWRRRSAPWPECQFALRFCGGHAPTAQSWQECEALAKTYRQHHVPPSPAEKSVSVGPPWPGQLWDQSRAALPGEIRPEPLALDTQAVLQLRQGEDVHERPHQPGEETARVQSAPFEHRVILADDCHVAFIEIAERMCDLGPLSSFAIRRPTYCPS